MRAEIDSISKILPNAKATGGWYHDHRGKKTEVIGRWIRSVLHKMIHYKADHQRVLDEAGTALQLAFPRDLVMSNVLSFLELP